MSISCEEENDGRPWGLLKFKVFLLSNFAIHFNENCKLHHMRYALQKDNWDGVERKRLEKFVNKFRNIELPFRKYYAKKIAFSH